MAEARAQGDPIRVATMYKFDAAEIEKLQAAVPNAKVEISIAGNREDFRAGLRNAEVVYESLGGADLS